MLQISCFIFLRCSSVLQVNQHLGKRLLEKLGYDVETASNGQEAVDKAMQMTFNCCFMDCQVRFHSDLQSAQ